MERKINQLLPTKHVAATPRCRIDQPHLIGTMITHV